MTDDVEPQIPGERTLLLIEGKPTGDGRMIELGATEFPSEPRPVMIRRAYLPEAATAVASRESADVLQRDILPYGVMDTYEREGDKIYVTVRPPLPEKMSLAVEVTFTQPPRQEEDQMVATGVVPISAMILPDVDFPWRNSL